MTQFGPRAVWHVGLQTLGYPPTWIATGSEFLEIQRELHRFHRA